MHPEENVCLIAISGGSGSGKSTLADAIRTVLGPDVCVVLGEDNYYKSRKENGIEGLSPPEIESIINFDHVSSKNMDMMRADIAALKRGETIKQPVYDFADHDRVEGEYEIIEPRRVTIVEGIHVLSDEDIAKEFDLKVYVDTPDDLRLARRILRDTAPEDQGGRGRSVERVISQYLHFVRPSHHLVTAPHKYSADLVIADEGLLAFSTSIPTRRAVMRMLAPVQNWLEDHGIVKPSEFHAYPDD